MKRMFGKNVALAILLGSTFLGLGGSLQLLAERNADVPILSAQAESDIFNALDLSRPALAPVAAAWRQGNRALAERELAQYFRSRTSVGWQSPGGDPPTLSPNSRTVADAAVEGKLQGGLVPLVYAFPNGRIDWRFNATLHTPGQAPSSEWQWQLNRMSFWSDLAVAYRATGDERYAEAFVSEMRSWIAQCPVPNSTGNDAGSAWRTIEAGIRMGGSWMDAFYAFRGSRAMSDADVVAMLHAFLDHGRYLRNHHTNLNWLTMEMSGLYADGAVFPEFREAADWRKFATNTLTVETRKQFLPDGAQVELSSGYQNVALDSFVHIAEVARWTGNEAELPADYLAPLEKAYEWQVAIATPDKHLPYINDSWPAYLPTIMRKAAIYFPAHADFQWLASNGGEGAPPPFTSTYLNRSGLAAMRSDWTPNANYLVFRVGPLGMGHQHQDSLGLAIWAYGRELLFNENGGNYEASKWRQWATSALGHNTVVVDGMGQTRPITQADPFHDPNMVSQGPINAHWETNGSFDFASGEYAQGYGPQHQPIASQKRSVLFLKPNIYIVADRLQPSDSRKHQYQARWQLLTTHSRIEPSTQTLVTEDGGLANMAVVPMLADHLQVRSASGQQEPEILGWNFRRGAMPELVPATTLLHTVTGSGPQLILTMFVALRPGEANPIKGVEPGRDGVSAEAIFTDGRRLAISCPGALGISVREILSNGQPGRSVTGGER